jgi:hypothetical protein
MKTSNKAIKTPFIPNMMILSASDVVTLPSVPETAIGVYRPAQPILTLVPKKIRQGKIAVTVNEVAYPSICKAMDTLGIPQDPHWYTIRRELKKNGKSTFTYKKIVYNFTV